MIAVSTQSMLHVMLVRGISGVVHHNMNDRGAAGAGYIMI